MFRYSLPLALLLASTCAVIPARAQQPQTKRVWTTDDMDDLRARGLISIVGIDAATVPAATVPTAPATPTRIYNSRTEDPSWYAEQAAQLQAQIAAKAAALAQAQDSIMKARSLRANTGSINLNAPDNGVTPEESIANLQTALNETQVQLENLADLARRNDIPPGVLRSSAA